ncbi:terpenoid synthase [Piedraia hortae CBS 480.64]|uniref:Terpenoid synthase n=1 Tax=Piedraia hortae CBS 480.64 TaxID=1314780 RepID=A0A6A7BUG9_9PEZI|nr:terpenoid synthase [Piedraia hortae CBS 480.64]
MSGTRLAGRGVAVATRPPTARQRCPRCSRPLLSHGRTQSTVAAAVRSALGGKTAGPMGIDPLRSVAKEMKAMTGNIQQLIGSGHPMLDTVSKYYTQSQGKYMRPMLVLLMSQATASLPKQLRPFSRGLEEVDEPMTPDSVLLDSKSPPSTTSQPETNPSIRPSQRRLAEITELIHTASLLHDDVLDTSATRRGKPSANLAFGNKMAVLAGDFLLGRASSALARTRDPEVIELLSTAIVNLVEGEFMQLKNTSTDDPNPIWTEAVITHYLQKTYLKTASLISKSCRAAALLGDQTSPVVEAAYQYGKNLGLAFQLVDDMLDYTVTADELGKPAGADLELGLATAPLLFAWKNAPELGTLVGRKFSQPGDVSRARDIVAGSDGVRKTRELAEEFVSKAVGAIEGFPEGEGKEGLLAMCDRVLKRRK